MLYAYLKPEKGESSFYIHLTLDDKAKTMRVYYHKSWWRKEDVDHSILTLWMNHCKNMAPLLTHSKKGHALVCKKNSVKVRGKCMIYSTMLKDIIGFVEKDTELELSAKIEAYTNLESKIIEVELELSYKQLGSLPRTISKLPIFSKNPDFESVRSRLAFFCMSYIRHMKHEQKVDKKTPNLEIIPNSTQGHGNQPIKGQPQNNVQPHENKPIEDLKIEQQPNQPTGDRVDTDQEQINAIALEFTLDKPYCQEGKHPFASELKADEPPKTPNK